MTPAQFSITNIGLLVTGHRKVFVLLSSKGLKLVVYNMVKKIIKENLITNVYRNNTISQLSN